MFAFLFVAIIAFSVGLLCLEMMTERRTLRWQAIQNPKSCCCSFFACFFSVRGFQPVDLPAVELYAVTGDGSGLLGVAVRN